MGHSRMKRSKDNNYQVFTNLFEVFNEGPTGELQPEYEEGKLERTAREKERQEKHLQRQLEREKYLRSVRKKYNVEYNIKKSSSMNMVDDVKKAYELNEMEAEELEAGIKNMEMKRQTSYQTIAQMAKKDEKK